MAKALGVGGVFFKAKNPAELAAWYQRWLDVPVDDSHTAPFKPALMPADSFTVWAPFAASTDYFAPSSKEFMFNLVVDDLPGALARVAEGGAKVVGEIAKYDFGRFGWFLDPEGNKVELWEPAESREATAGDESDESRG